MRVSIGSKVQCGIRKCELPVGQIEPLEMSMCGLARTHTYIYVRMCTWYRLTRKVRRSERVKEDKRKSVRQLNANISLHLHNVFIRLIVEPQQKYNYQVNSIH